MAKRNYVKETEKINKRPANQSGRAKKKGYSKDSEKATSKQSVSKTDKFTGGNDISFYANDPNVVATIGALNTSYPLNGMSNPIYGKGLHDKNGDTVEFYRNITPGVCRVGIVPMVGRAQDATDAISVAAQHLFSMIRKTNTSYITYEPVDLMYYVLAFDSLYMLWTHCVRAYGVYSSYYYLNGYYPRVMLETMGFNPDFMKAHAPEIREYLNYVALQISSKAVPASLKLIQRHAWLFQNIFTDRPGDRAQSYVFCPSGLYKYGTPKEISEPSLEYVDLSLMKINSMQELMDLFDQFLTPIMSSEDVSVIHGDILKAFGSDIVKLSTIPENYKTIPIYSDLILEQIENLTVVPVDTSSLNIRQRGQVLYQDVVIRGTVASSKHLNFKKEDVTPEDIIYATRLTTLYGSTNWSSSQNDYPKLKDLQCGTELVNSLQIIWIDPTRTENSGRMYLARNSILRFEQSEELWKKTPIDLQTFEFMILSSHFNSFPHFEFLHKGLKEIQGFEMGDTQVSVPLTSSNLAAINRASVYHAFGIPYNFNLDV